jgi:circadian clock protein KaiC
MKRIVGGGEQRFLRVEKLRGCTFSPGLHSFSITAQGVQVFPRLRTPEKFSGYKMEPSRLRSGIDGLDNMVDAGFWRGSSTMVAGPTGSGKTTLGLQFLYEGARNNEPSVFVGFQENPIQIARQMRAFGWNPDKLVKAGSFRHLYYSPVEMHFDEVAVDLFRRVEKGKIRRVVIDSLNDLKRRSLDADRFAEYIYALTQWFTVRNVTCLLTHELTQLFEFHTIAGEETSNMADNIILLRFTPDREMARTIRIVKSRGSAHDQHEHLLTISKKGVAVGKPTSGKRGQNSPKK